MKQVIACFKFFAGSRSVVVSAGILRVLGKEAAELPLAATRQENQGRVSRYWAASYQDS